MRPAAFVAGVAAVAALAVAPAAQARPLPVNLDYVQCEIDRLTTPPPEEPHTPMMCSMG